MAGYEYAAAFSINDNGRIVGRANNSDMNPFDNYNPLAVLFNTNDSNNNLDLGTLPGYDAAEAYAINNKGQIIGWAVKNSSITAAVLFDPSGQGNNINLNDLINPLSGWQLQMASCINDNNWIAGWGICPEGYHHAFLLIPIPAGPADFDQNGKVDFYDFATFAAAWDTASWNDNYNPACDLEPDGQIDYYDLAIFANGWAPD